MLLNIIYGIQIASAVLLVTAILIQARGSGMGGAFGGDSAIFTTKRGAEKTIFRITIGLAALFLAASLAHIFF